MVTTKHVEKILSDVAPARNFIIHNGGEVKNLKMLAEALPLMPALSFHYHVSKHHNDFAEWVRDIVGDWQLADSIEHAETKREMAESVMHRVESLNRAVSEHSLSYDPFMFSGAKEFIVGITIGFIIGMIFSIAV